MEREIVGSRAFNIENERIYTNEAMRKDIVSYLSEYRLRVQKFDYELLYSYKEGEGYKIRDIYQGEAMTQKAKRTIQEREALGLSVHREMAELLGLRNLGEQLLVSQEGDRIFWFSPPGPKEEGYGDYGFLFEGKVVGKHIFMTANRIEKPTILQCNRALFNLTGENILYTSAEEFLANPRVIVRDVAVGTDSILRKNFSFVVDEKEAWINRQVIAEMDSMIDEFIVVIKTGTREEKTRTFYALENYALELKERHKAKGSLEDYYRYLTDIVFAYGNHRPPAIAGSCGPTGEETRSNDIFADQYKDLMKAIFGDLFESLGLDEDEEWFTCPSCHYKATGPIGNMCPGCHLTKEQYAKESGQLVCE